MGILYHKSGFALDEIVGGVPAKFNMLASPQVFVNGFNPFTQLNDAWNFQQSSATGGVTAPDGTSTASHLTEDSSNNTHSMVSFFGSSHFGVTYAAGAYGQFRFAFIAKAAQRTRCVLLLSLLDNATGLMGTVSAGFDLAGGNVGYDNANTTGSAILGASMKLLTAGWYLCIVDCTFVAVSNPSTGMFLHPFIYLDNGSGTAARSTTYTGNGTSGINIWWGSLLPIGAWQLTDLAFFDDFNSISTIDINNTQVPGFNWYVANTWPDNSTIANGAAFFDALHFNLMPPTFLTPSDISVSGSSVTMARELSGYGEGLTTAYPIHPNRYGGKVFGYPAVFEASMAWDDALLNPSGTFFRLGWPDFWGSAIEMLTNNPPQFPVTNFREDDIIEATNTYGCATHDWFVTNPGIISDTGATGAALPNILLSTMNFSNQNNFAHMTIPAAFNGGQFSVALYLVNGLMVGSNFWGATIRPDNDAGKPIGALVSGDSQHIPLMIGSGHISTDGTYSLTSPPATWVPLTCDYVKAWQTTATGGLYPAITPVLSSPTDVATGTTTAAISVKTNVGNGTLSWVVTLSAIPPTAAQIEAGQDHTGAAATASGSKVVGATGVQSFNVSGLTFSTTYTAHFVQVSALNLTSNVASAAGFTTNAPTAPVLTHPTASPIGSVEAALGVTTDTSTGTLYWVVTLSSTTPTAAQVKAGEDHTGAAATASGSQSVTATGVQTATATGLSAATSYTAFFMQEAFGTFDSNIPSAGFTTLSTSWDPISGNAGVTLTNSDLTASATVAYNSVRSSVGKSSGKFYWEITINSVSASNGLIGLCDTGFNNNDFPGDYANSYGQQGAGGFFVTGWSDNGNTGSFTWTAGDIIGFALDATNGKAWFSKNGVWQGFDPTGTAQVSGMSGTIYCVTTPINTTLTANFGGSAFTYSVPSGFTGGLM